MELPSFCDCTPKCRSSRHADELLAVITQRTIELAQLKAFFARYCHNAFTATDRQGRNALQMAASCGQLSLLEWLLEEKRTDMKCKDKESGWTCLHRALYYGHVDCAVRLINAGASMYKTDLEGLTPLDLVTRDLQAKPLGGGLTETYTWGSNDNFNLGHAHQQARPHPDLVEELARHGVSVRQVVMCKFHTVFLGDDGRVFTCGHGLGRLGHGNQETYVTPRQVKFGGGGGAEVVCRQVAAARDHTVFLTESGHIYTCGVNSTHQLGHPTLALDQQCLHPRVVSLRALKGPGKGKPLPLGVAAGRFHTAFHSSNGIYTFGLNGGQLGLLKTGERYQVTPAVVTAVIRESDRIQHLVCSDGATVCATLKGDVYLLRHHKCSKIVSRQFKLVKVVAYGGQLSDVGVTGHEGVDSLVVMTLNEAGRVFCWKESESVLRRCRWSFASREVSISDLAISKNILLFVTSGGDVLTGRFSKRPSRSTTKRKPSSSSSAAKIHGALSLEEVFNTDGCESIALEQCQYLHQALSVVAEPKGRNFAVVQANPKSSLTEVPVVSEGALSEDMAALLQEASLSDSIHDLRLQVRNVEYPAHKYVLASSSEYFLEKVSKQDPNCNDDDDGRHLSIRLDNVDPEIFRLLLQCIYTNTCDLFRLGYDQFKGRGDPAKLLCAAAKKFKVHKLAERLEKAHYDCGAGRAVGVKPCARRLQFNRKRPALAQLHDVVIHSELDQGVSSSSSSFSLHCHKCLLAARLEYFHGMLSSAWVETSTDGVHELRLPVSGKVLELLVDYLYTDRGAAVEACADINLLGNLLTVANQLLVNRLKQMCQAAMATLVTLKNVCDLLEFSSAYNADQLKKTCQQFITLNLPTLLETKALDVLSEEVLRELSVAYREQVPGMRYKVITPYSLPEHITSGSAILAAGGEGANRGGVAHTDFAAIKRAATKSRRKSQQRRKSSTSSNQGRRSESESLAVSGKIEEEVGEVKVELEEEGEELLLASTSAELSQASSDKENREDGRNLESSSECGSEATCDSPLTSPRLPPSAINMAWKLGVSFGSPPTPPQQTLDLRSIMELEKSASKVKKVKQRSPSSKPAITVAKSKPRPNSSSCPWASSGPSVGSVSLREMIENQKQPKESKSATPKKSRPEKIPKTRRSLSQQLTQPPPPQAGSPDSKTRTAWKSPGSGLEASTAHPSAAATATAAAAVSFMDILHSEEERLENLQRILNKPLASIQAEERAMEELLAQYKAEGNPEEFITVERVQGYLLTDTPVWKKLDKK